MNGDYQVSASQNCIIIGIQPYPRNYIHILPIGLGSYASGSRLHLPLLE